ncbi:MAG: FG-GAP-like repeat-containing protein [Burkholderiales bacterium]
MKTKPVWLRCYFRSLALILVILAVSAPAFSGQIGFYPVSPSVDGVRGYAVGDLNGDGRDDLVSVFLDTSMPVLPDGSGSTISGYVNVALTTSLNATDGSFQGNSRLATTLYTYQPSLMDLEGRFVKQLADINGDGKPDIILFDVYVDNGQLAGSPRGPSKTAVFYGNGDGTFNPAFAVLGLPSDATEGQFSTRNGAYADMNSDGKADYVAPSQTGFNILIYFGNGSGGFSPSPSSSTPVSSPAGSTLTDIKSLVVVDVNKDGVQDMLFIADNPTAASANEQSLHLMTGAANGTFVDTIVDTFHAPTDSFTKLVAQNTLVEGKVAILLTRNRFFVTQNMDPDYPARAYLGNGQGLFGLVTSLNGTPSVFADFDGDGQIDVLTYAGSIGSTSSFRVNRGAGAGLYSDAGTFAVPSDGDQATLSGPHRFGNGSTPSVLLSNYSFIFLRSSVTPVVTHPGPQKQFTATSVTLPFPIFSRQSFTVTATVVASGPISPSGTVVFKLDSTIIGSTPLANGVATIVVANGTTEGNHRITSEYGGDTANSSSSTFRNFSVARYVPPLPKIVSVTDDTVKEGQKAKFKVSFSAATTEAASVRVTLLDGTTSGALDYSTTLKYSDDNGMTYQSLGSGGTAGVRAGATSLLIQVDTLKDNINEPTETFNLSVEPLSGLATDRGWAVGTILNKSAKHNSMFDQVRSIRDEVARKSDSVTSSIRNWVSMSVFSRLFSWR